MANESAEERERAILWDALHYYGAMGYYDLMRVTGVHHQRARFLCDHEWFSVRCGFVEIAMVSQNDTKCDKTQSIRSF